MTAALLTATAAAIAAHAALLVWAIAFIAEGWRADIAVQRWRAPLLWALIVALPAFTIAVLSAWVFLSFGVTR